MVEEQNLRAYLDYFLSGLVQQKIKRAVISPGSRSTPLALLLHQCPQIETFVHIDERSAAFFALGMSKASEEPVVLVCTSGTAAANYYPAICEAKESNTPLIIVTTDRPLELQLIGAPQTMNQESLYGQQVKYFVSMPLADSTQAVKEYAHFQAVKAVQIAQQRPIGPVHLNMPFREPLIPSEQDTKNVPNFHQSFCGKSVLTQEEITQIKDKWQGKRGILIVSGSQNRSVAKQYVALANALKWPLFADPLSNVRNCGMKSDTILSYYDLYMGFLDEQWTPEVIVKVGNPIISKSFNQWVRQLSCPMYVIDCEMEWKEPTLHANYMIQAENENFVKMMLSSGIKQSDNRWLKQWNSLEQRVKRICEADHYLCDFTEAACTKLVLDALLEDAYLFVSNSMAIRYVDRFSGKAKKSYTLLANRGVNGIDGIVSTALGMAQIHPGHENVLLIGDLAFCHDMNALLLAKSYHIPLTIIIINNQGGGIFSFLPQNQLNPVDFETLFGTPQDLDFTYVAKLYEAQYQEVKTLDELRKCLTEEKNVSQLRILELKTSRVENSLDYENLCQKIFSEVTGEKNASKN